jgi:murein DD-endopeptidase MepM/ murein hydrolase activator NlpD
MGAGGLYVCIDHGESAEEKLVSCYMHLEAATVVQDRVVTRGEQIGRVGTSGIKQSRPHLHFELHASDGVHASLEVLRGIAIGSPTVHAPPQADETSREASESTPTL